ncbi:hypothetical protein VTN00DRAFT_9502 [Thermoascus crustaceus]|uniref:uncharacterized protein n=1 Tax=Thermoascus crustaceus TaxID=5088 RepID=UPI0037442072
MQFANLVLSTLCLALTVSGQTSGMSGMSMASNSSKAASQGQVRVHVVQVGMNGSLAFSPNQLQVNPGEMVQFQFHPKNHSVVQSTFDNPCTPMAESMPNMTGFRSGFMPVAADATELPVFTMMVNDTKPMWMYCSQATHCQKGMVMAINVAPGSKKSFEAFRSLAMSSSSSSTGSSGSGATVGSGTSSGSSGSSSSSVPASNSSSGAVGSATPSSSTPVQTTNGAPRSVANAAGLLVLVIAGFAFVGL